MSISRGAKLDDRSGPSRSIELSSRSASQIGSKISFAAVCASRSSMVGIPSARSPPPGLAIIFRLTGCGWYVLSCRSFLQAVQPARLDVLEALSVYPRRAFIGFGQSVSVQQNVLSVHLVVKLVETEFRLVLRLAIQLDLQVPNFIRRDEVSGANRELRGRLCDPQSRNGERGIGVDR